MRGRLNFWLRVNTFGIKKLRLTAAETTRYRAFRSELRRSKFSPTEAHRRPDEVNQSSPACREGRRGRVISSGTHGSQQVVRVVGGQVNEDVGESSLVNLLESFSHRAA